MLSVHEALRKISERAAPLPACAAPLGRALGRVLAEDVLADVDSPPADKALVDGYAVIAGDLAKRLASGPVAVLRVLEEVVAGSVPTAPVTEGTATRIMTGAPMPDGADAVVMVEQTSLRIASDGRAEVCVSPPAVAAGRNRLLQGASFRAGEKVLAAGRRLGPAEIGLLAEVGRDRVAVVPAPRVAILVTGDELVDCRVRPGPGQIRNSNGPMLAALVAAAGAAPVELGIARDNAAELRRTIALGLENEVLVLSGGVSAGVADLVPAALAELGVEQVFHKIRMKPGKPLWFGVAPPPAADAASGRLVFGHPGNPVSSLVCFHLFVRPAIARLAGMRQETSASAAALTHEFDHCGERPTFFPAFARPSPPSAGAACEVTLTAWKGSADLRSLTDANCLACFPEGDRHYAAGDLISITAF